MIDQVLITGATGFVGKNLIPYLSSENVNVIKLDLRNMVGEYKLPAGVNAIIHLAGKAHDLKNTTQPEEYYKINYELTKKLFDAFVKSDVQKFIFISSVKAAADTVNDVLKEDDIPLPETHYGKSKLKAEQYIKQYPLPSGKSFYILRPCMIHGPGNKGNLNLLYQFVKRKLPYPLASFQNKRSFLSIENLCFVIEQLLNAKTLDSGIYNVADDDPLSTVEVVEILAESMSRKPQFWHIPTKLVHFLAKIGDLTKLPLNSDRLTKLTENYVVSNKKIKINLGIDLPRTAKEGLRLTANSFKENQK